MTIVPEKARGAPDRKSPAGAEVVVRRGAKVERGTERVKKIVMRR